MSCKVLETLNIALNKIGSPYDIIEEFLPYPRHKETLALTEVSKRIPCDEICETLIRVEETLERASEICVILPGLGSSEMTRISHFCRKGYIAAETASAFLRDRGIRALIITTDLDASEDLISSYFYISSYFFVHIHGDNFIKVVDLLNKKNIVRRSVFTTQIKGQDCVLGPFGFTDGDRAVLIPMLFGVKKIYVYGYDLSKPRGKRYYTLEKTAKMKLGYLITHYYASRLGYRIIDKKNFLELIKC